MKENPEGQTGNTPAGVCIYPVVFIPKCRRRTLYTQLRRSLGEVFHHLARQKERTMEEDHVLLMVKLEEGLN